MKRFQEGGLIFVGALLLMSEGFRNGFPLLFSDSGSYIDAGFYRKVTEDRPAIYGQFIRLVSGGHSVWWVVFFQCFLLSALLFFLFHYFCQSSKKSGFLFIGTLMFLSLYTALSYTASAVLPDIFTSIVVIILALLLSAELSLLLSIFLSLLFLLAVMVHYSHFLMILVVWGGFFLFSILKRLQKHPLKIPLKRWVITGGLVLIPWILLPTIHQQMGYGFAMSRVTHVFVVGKMVETNILKKFLDKFCPTSPYSLCDDKDNLPSSMAEFLFSSKSPLRKNGNWQDKKEEYDRLIGHVLKTPQYFFYYLGSLGQFMGISFSDFIVEPYPVFQREDWSPHKVEEFFYPGDMNDYLNSRQFQMWRGYNFPRWSENHKIVGSLSVMSLLIYLFTSFKVRGVDKSLEVFVSLTLLGVFSNALVCGGLTAFNAHRFMARIWWLVPLCVILILASPRKKGAATY